MVSSPFIYFCYLLPWSFAYVLCLSEILSPLLSTIQSLRDHSGLCFFSNYDLYCSPESQIGSYFIIIYKYRACLFKVVLWVPNASLYRSIQNDQNEDNVAFIIERNTLHLKDLYFADSQLLYSFSIKINLFHKMMGLTGMSVVVKGFGGQTGCIQIPVLLKLLTSLDVSFLKSGGNNYIHTYTRVHGQTCIHTYTYIMLCTVMSINNICYNMLMILIINHVSCVFIKRQKGYK